MTQTQPYEPVGCGIYDLLEAAAVRRALTEIRYVRTDGAEARYTGIVLDVFARGREEFVRLEGGEEIRLDRLTSVNGTVNDRCRVPPREA